jgi:hypothetical protein
MKSVLVFLFACCLLALVDSKDKPTLNPYPLVFSAQFNASSTIDLLFCCKITKLSILDLPLGILGQMSSFYLDVPNKRARAMYPYLPGDWLLIFRPSGADPDSVSCQHFKI